MTTDQGAREVEEQLEASKEVLDAHNTSSVLSPVLNTITDQFQHECLDQAVQLLNVHSIRQLTDDRVPGYKYSIPGLRGIMFLEHQVSAI
jgi:hypothetical protein